MKKFFWNLQYSVQLIIVSFFVGLSLLLNVGCAKSNGSLSLVNSVPISSTTADHLVLVAGDNQTSSVGTLLSIAPKVQVVDATGNPVSGYTVNFTVLTGSGSVGAASVVSDASGYASVSYTLGGSAGSNTMKAENTSLPGTPKSITFTETGTAGAADHLVLVAGDGQSATVGTAVATDPKVQVVDSSGNPVSGYTVNFTVLTGGGSVGAASVVSDVSGYASVSYTLGGSAGSNTMKAENTSLPGTPKSITFTETGLGLPTKLGFIAQPTSAVAGASITPPIQVAVQDADGNTVTSASATVTLSIATNPGGGTLAGTVSAATVLGVATFSDIWINKVGTGYTLAASSTPVYTATTSSAFNITAGSASLIMFTGGPSPIDKDLCSTVYTITTQDAYGNTSAIGSAINVALSENGAGAGVFYSTSNCTGGSEVTQVTIPGLGSSTTFYFKHNTRETIILTADAGGPSGLTAGTKSVKVRAKTAYSYTGSNGSFVVPGDATSITIKAWSAGGGGGNGGTGGGGGFAQADLTVTPSETLTVIVGGGGDGITGYAGGGGGRSGIRRGTTELVTAGAGGGGGYAGNPAAGGAGGGVTGGTGEGGIYGGGGGTATVGGTGGSGSGGGGAYPGNSGGHFYGGNAYDTGQGPGGWPGGGAGATFGGAGGGGDGWYGGGGGGYNSGPDTRSGGGGGSSNADIANGASNITLTSGSVQNAGNNLDIDYLAGIGRGGDVSANGGNGRIVIIY